MIFFHCDDTNADTYGAQQGNLFSTYYGGHCLMPFLIFAGQYGKLVMPVLRPGRRNKSINFCGYMKRIITRIRKSWKKTQIVVRGDSHFCSHEFMEWARSDRRIVYITGLAQNKTLSARTLGWVRAVEEDYKKNRKFIVVAELASQEAFLIIPPSKYICYVFYVNNITFNVFASRYH